MNRAQYLARQAERRAKRQKGHLKILLKLVEEADRPCGACQACCVVMGVDSVQKGMYAPCRHQCEQGCGIYERRPLECKGFACLWKIGLLGAERPDVCGLMPTYERDANLTGGEVWVVLYELWPFALLSDLAVECVRRCLTLKCHTVRIVAHCPAVSRQAPKWMLDARHAIALLEAWGKAPWLLETHRELQGYYDDYLQRVTKEGGN